MVIKIKDSRVRYFEPFESNMILCRIECPFNSLIYIACSGIIGMKLTVYAACVVVQVPFHSLRQMLESIPS